MTDFSRLAKALTSVSHSDALIGWLRACHAERGTRWFAARLELDILLFDSPHDAFLLHVSKLALKLANRRLAASPLRQFAAFCASIKSPADAHPIGPPADEYAHLCSFKDFATHHGARKDVYFDDVLIASPEAEELWRQLVDQDTPGSCFDGTLGAASARGVVWLTRPHFIPAPATKPADDAVCVEACVQLGLWDFAGGEPCVLVRIPAAAGPDPRRPTMFDALGREAFCPGRDSEGWGLALRAHDLEDGAAEVIHHAIPWDEQFRVRGLGRASRDAFTVREAPESLADSALSRRWPLTPSNLSSDDDSGH